MKEAMYKPINVNVNLKKSCDQIGLLGRIGFLMIDDKQEQRLQMDHFLHFIFM